MFLLQQYVFNNICFGFHTPFWWQKYLGRSLAGLETCGLHDPARLCFTFSTTFCIPHPNARSTISLQRFMPLCVLVHCNNLFYLGIWIISRTIVISVEYFQNFLQCVLIATGHMSDGWALQLSSISYFDLTVHFLLYYAISMLLISAVWT